MTVVTLAAFAPFIALLGAIINGFFGQRLREPLPGIIAATAVGTGFVLSLLAFAATVSMARFIAGRQGVVGSGPRRRGRGA